jgi:hypothetical protein
MVNFLERHVEKIAGALSCLDRVVITGTFPDICHAEAATRYLFNHHIRIFDYTQFAEPLRDQLRSHAEKLATDSGLTIEFLRNHDVRKGDRIQEILEQRGRHPGLVHIFSAMESCPSFQPWHDKTTGKTFLKYKDGKCLHDYFSLIDPMLGLCYLRVPTWAPFRLQFSFNGHNLLAHKLDLEGIGYRMIDNAFVAINDWQRARVLAKTIPVPTLHRKLDQLARTCCPVIAQFRSGVHGSLMQVEYATDLVFHKQDVLRPLSESLSRTAIHAVKCEQVATFLGHRLTDSYEGEIGNDFSTRLEGTRIKHDMGPAAIKMYDKFALVLRVETTCNDVTFFKHHRRVEHRDGSWEMKLAAMKEPISSLPDLMGLLDDANRRYLEFLGTLDDPTAGVKRREKIAEPVHDDGRSHRGFNLFAGDDLDRFQAISRGQFTISGFRNRDLRECLPGHSGAQLGRMIKRLRAHGLLKKIGKRSKYYLTKLGRTVVTTALKLRELFIIPSLNEPARV